MQDAPENKKITSLNYDLSTLNNKKKSYHRNEWRKFAAKNADLTLKEAASLLRSNGSGGGSEPEPEVDQCEDCSHSSRRKRITYFTLDRRRATSDDDRLWSQANLSQSCPPKSVPEGPKKSENHQL